MSTPAPVQDSQPAPAQDLETAENIDAAHYINRKLINYFAKKFAKDAATAARAVQNAHLLDQPHYDVKYRKIQIPIDPALAKHLAKLHHESIPETIPEVPVTKPTPVKVEVSQDTDVHEEHQKILQELAENFKDRQRYLEANTPTPLEEKKDDVQTYYAKALDGIVKNFENTANHLYNREKNLNDDHRKMLQALKEIARQKQLALEAEEDEKEQIAVVKEKIAEKIEREPSKDDVEDAPIQAPKHDDYEKPEDVVDESIKVGNEDIVGPNDEFIENIEASVERQAYKPDEVKLSIPTPIPEKSFETNFFFQPQEFVKEIEKIVYPEHNEKGFSFEEPALHEDITEKISNDKEDDENDEDDKKTEENEEDDKNVTKDSEDDEEDGESKEVEKQADEKQEEIVISDEKTNDKPQEEEKSPEDEEDDEEENQPAEEAGENKEEQPETEKEEETTDTEDSKQKTDETGVTSLIGSLDFDKLFSEVPSFSLDSDKNEADSDKKTETTEEPKQELEQTEVKKKTFESFFTEHPADFTFPTTFSSEKPAEETIPTEEETKKPETDDDEEEEEEKKNEDEEAESKPEIAKEEEEVKSEDEEAETKPEPVKEEEKIEDDEKVSTPETVDEEKEDKEASVENVSTPEEESEEETTPEDVEKEGEEETKPEEGDAEEPEEKQAVESPKEQNTFFTDQPIDFPPNKATEESEEPKPTEQSKETDDTENDDEEDESDDKKSDETAEEESDEATTAKSEDETEESQTFETLKETPLHTFFTDTPAFDFGDDKKPKVETIAPEAKQAEAEEEEEEEEEERSEDKKTENVETPNDEKEAEKEEEREVESKSTPANTFFTEATPVDTEKKAEAQEEDEEGEEEEEEGEAAETEQSPSTPEPQTLPTQQKDQEDKEEAKKRAEEEEKRKNEENEKALREYIIEHFEVDIIDGVPVPKGVKDTPRYKQIVENVKKPHEDVTFFKEETDKYDFAKEAGSFLNTFFDKNTKKLDKAGNKIEEENDEPEEKEEEEEDESKLSETQAEEEQCEEEEDEPEEGKTQQKAQTQKKQESFQYPHEHKFEEIYGEFRNNKLNNPHTQGSNKLEVIHPNLHSGGFKQKGLELVESGEKVVTVPYEYDYGSSEKMVVQISPPISAKRVKRQTEDDEWSYQPESYDPSFSYNFEVAQPKGGQAVKIDRKDEPLGPKAVVFENESGRQKTYIRVKQKEKEMFG